MSTYTTLVEVKEHLGLESSNVDALLTQLIAAISEAIDQYCLRPLSTRTSTIKHDYQGSMLLYVDQWLLSVTTLTNGDGVVLVPDVDYFLNPRSGPPYRMIEINPISSKRFQPSTTVGYRQCISIAGSWGLSTAQLAPIKLAANLWIAEIMNLRGDEGHSFSKTTDTTTTISEIDPTKPPLAVCRYLNRWRWKDYRQC